MVIWPDFRMGQYSVNDHPYHAPRFTTFGHFRHFLSFEPKCPEKILKYSCNHFSHPSEPIFRDREYFCDDTFMVFKMNLLSNQNSSQCCPMRDEIYWIMKTDLYFNLIFFNFWVIERSFLSIHNLALIIGCLRDYFESFFSKIYVLSDRA